jgi:hypothetical protein
VGGRGTDPNGSVKHVFGTTRSVFERVRLPAVQGKCATDLYVTSSEDFCEAAVPRICTTVEMEV